MTKAIQRRSIDFGVLTFWGSECTVCGNATHGSMTCDNCGLPDNTVALWMEKK